MEKKDHIGIITLNREKEKNTFTPEFAELLNRYLKDMDKDEDVRVVVINANGKHFSTGISLDQFSSKTHREYRDLMEKMDAHNHTIANMKKPVVASVKGFAIANGAGLVFASDMAIAAESSKFGTTAINVGLICLGPAVPLSRLVSRKKLLEMVLGGDIISADEAEKTGLINKVVPDDELEQATMDLAEKAGLTPKDRVLDVGCGIGGSSRLLAETTGCFVTGIDMVDPFVQAARFLTRSTGLKELNRFEQGDIVHTDFPDNSFDCIWCQHTLMNIKDKASLFAEFRRLLVPQGKLVLHEVIKGETDRIHLPVPWADDHGISFLEPWEEINLILTRAGFKRVYHQDLTEQAKQWWQRVKAAFKKMPEKPRPLGPHILFGNNGTYFGITMDANLQKNRIRVVEAVFSLD